MGMLYYISITMIEKLGGEHMPRQVSIGAQGIAEDRIFLLFSKTC